MITSDLEWFAERLAGPQGYLMMEASYRRVVLALVAEVRMSRARLDYVPAGSALQAARAETDAALKSGAKQ